MKVAFSLVALVALWNLTAVHGVRGAVPLTPMEASEPGRQFVELLVKGDFAAAEAQFDTRMKGALAEGKLRDTWATVIKENGAFQKQTRVRTDHQGGYKIVTVTCRFEKAAVDARVVFDAKGQVAGLYFAPAAPEAAAFKMPPYAKADSYSEKEFTVGSGEWKLPGTLTMPKGANQRVPAVVLVQGSGPCDRDETVGANKPFRDLA